MLIVLVSFQKPVDRLEAGVAAMQLPSGQAPAKSTISCVAFEDARFGDRDESGVRVVLVSRVAGLWVGPLELRDAKQLVRDFLEGINVDAVGFA
jgi:hypothetical protein